jgi:hypothetical protein
MLTTKQLLNLANINQYKIIEASLLLGFNSKATHFFSLKKSLLFDEGIDGQITKWRKDEFILHYKNATWILDQIV